MVSPLINLSFNQSHPDEHIQTTLLLSLLWLYTAQDPTDLKVILNGTLVI